MNGRLALWFNRWKAVRRRIRALRSENASLILQLQRYRELAIRIGANKDYVPPPSDRLTTGPRPSAVEIAVKPKRKSAMRPRATKM